MACLVRWEWGEMFSPMFMVVKFGSDSFAGGFSNVTNGWVEGNRVVEVVPRKGLEPAPGVGAE